MSDKRLPKFQLGATDMVCVMVAIAVVVFLLIADVPLVSAHRTPG